mmetsp:Transcript_71008/g.160707  ORF Transcript_71008/g.160707 Transcript_71008/m.160707 type:complete len:186 (+) Transcript_71008:498-1055(+)
MPCAGMLPDSPDAIDDAGGEKGARVTVLINWWATLRPRPPICSALPASAVDVKAAAAIADSALSLRVTQDPAAAKQQAAVVVPAMLVGWPEPNTGNNSRRVLTTQSRLGLMALAASPGLPTPDLTAAMMTTEATGIAGHDGHVRVQWPASMYAKAAATEATKRRRARSTKKRRKTGSKHRGNGGS